MHSRFSIACAFGGLMFMAGCTPRSEPIEKGPAPEIGEQAPAKEDSKPVGPTAGIHKVTIQIPEMATRLGLT